MKKTFTLLAVFAIALCASCSKDQEIETEDKIVPGEEEIIPGGGITEFEADIPESKTYLGEKGASGWPNYWSNGDVIYVHNVTSKALKTGDGYVGTNYARFSMNDGVSPVGEKYYAAYPAARMSGWNSSTKKATVTIPATQTFTAGNYDPSAYVMVGTSTTPRLNFSPVMGLIKLTTTAPDVGTLYIKSISVEPVGDEKMSGAFTTDYSTISASGSATSSVTISAASGSTKTFGTVFTFAVPAQNYASGIRFRITAVPNADGTGDEQVAVFSKQSAFNVAAGTLYPLTAPAFKETGVTISLIRALTSSSIQIRWDGSNVSNNKNKAWRIHAYTNSACTTEFGSGWTIPADPNSIFWDSDKTYLTFCVGGLQRETDYWFKVEDVQNGIMSAASSVTTQSFSQVSMPGTISTTGVVFAEDFNQIPWGSTVCFRRCAGFMPANTSSFNNLSTDGATFYDWGSYTKGNTEISFRASALDAALSSSRLNNWMSEGDVYVKPGHIKLGRGSTSGWILTPPFPIASGKTAVVNVTVEATKYSASAQSDYAIAVLSSSLVGSGSGNRESSFTWPDTSDETLYKTVSFPSDSEWESDSAEGLVLSPGDRLVFGRRNGGGDTNPRLFVNSITVEATGIEDDLYKIKDVATLQYFMTNKPDAAIVTADINMSGQSFTTISGYTGTLYGNGHTISDLTVPMFDELQGTVRDLTLNSKLNITTKHGSSSGLGIFANKMTASSSLIGCTSKGFLTYCPSSAVTSGEIRVGGLVGYLNLGSLTDCKNEASVTLNDNAKSNEKAINIGGIAGHAFNTSRQYMTSCTNKGIITNNCSTSGAIYVGGICGKTYTVTITNCKNENDSAEITISNSGNANNGTNQLCIGGVFGMIQKNTIVSGVCYNKEAVSNTGKGSVRLGGFVGQSDQGNTFEASNTTYHYNEGTVTENSASSNIYVGGFCGYANNAKDNFSYCRNNGDINIKGGTRNKLFVGGFIGITTACVTFDYAQNSGDIDFDGVDVSGQVFCGGIHGGWDSTGYGTQTVTGCVNSGKITADGSEGSDLKSTANSKKWSLFGGISGVGGEVDEEGLDVSSYTSSTGLQTITGKTFKNCSNTGAIYLYLKLYYTVGGVVAIAGNNPSGCSCVANITVKRWQGNTTGIRNHCGGIAGYTHDDLTAVSNVKYNGTLYTFGSTNAAYSGGIVGRAGCGITFTNCKVGGSMRGATNEPNSALFAAQNSTQNYSFSSCAVKKGTVVYYANSSTKATINSTSDLSVAKCFSSNGSPTNTDGTISTQISVPSSI